MKADARRALRSITQAVGAAWALGLLTALIVLLDGSPEWRGWIAIGLVLILLVRELFHGAENVAARMDFKVDRTGASGSFDSRREVDASAPSAALPEPQFGEVQ